MFVVLAVSLFAFLICPHTHRDTYTHTHAGTECPPTCKAKMSVSCFGSSSSRATRTIEDTLYYSMHRISHSLPPPSLCLSPPSLSLFPSLFLLLFTLPLVLLGRRWHALTWPTSGMCHAPSYLHFCCVSFVAQRQLWTWSSPGRVPARCASSNKSTTCCARCTLHVAASPIASGSPRRGRFCFIFALYILVYIYKYMDMHIVLGSDSIKPFYRPFLCGANRRRRRIVAVVVAAPCQKRLRPSRANMAVNKFTT